jgi:DNA-binding transcriptional LysR family regulator
MYQLLQSFIQIVELKSVSAAARKLYRTQPALTRQIRQLEGHFGCRLLVRSGNSMELTPEGSTLYTAAKKAVIPIEQLEHIFESPSKSHETLMFSTIDSATASILPAAINKFLKKHDVQLRPLVMSSRLAYNALLRDEIDFAICTIDSAPATLRCEKLFKEDLVLIGPEKCTGKEAKSQIASRSFILLPEISTIREMIDGFFKRHKIHPHIVLETIKVSAIISFVEAGLGLSIVPEYSVRSEQSHHNITDFQFQLGSGAR